MNSIGNSREKTGHTAVDFKVTYGRDNIQHNRWLISGISYSNNAPTNYIIQHRKTSSLSHLER